MIIALFFISIMPVFECWDHLMQNVRPSQQQNTFSIFWRPINFFPLDIANRTNFNGFRFTVPWATHHSIAAYSLILVILLFQKINYYAVASCGASLVGPSGSFGSPNNPNSYPDNAYCRWKISVPADKKVLVTFNSFKTQKGNDVVEIYDGSSKQLITTLSGVYSSAVAFASESNSIDIRFISDSSENSEGFSASYQQVSK